MSLDLSTLDINSLQAKERIKAIVTRTPLQYNLHLSEKYGADVYLKRGDLQVVRSYKLRGAFNKISSLSAQQRAAGVGCASAGHHAQGVACSCTRLDIQGVIFMPGTTPRHDLAQTEMWRNGNIEIILTGDNFDDCQKAAIDYCAQNNMTFIPPFDDLQIIEGQGTVAVEILEDLPEVDAILLP